MKWAAVIIACASYGFLVWDTAFTLRGIQPGWRRSLWIAWRTLLISVGTLAFIVALMLATQGHPQ